MFNENVCSNDKIGQRHNLIYDCDRVSHPFDRYAAFTDLAVLKDYSARPLRKSIRVNTLKMSVEDFLAYAKKKKWELTPVPWCREGFYIDRENREEALGRDLFHLLGYFYMQEAASMLPPALLDAKPGDAVLDMSAAPGSKTTQIGASLVYARDDTPKGIIVANDVQEKRLWTLKNAIHRTGLTNVIVTKKVGQWFSKHMTERFDRILCDAPCTAQGTSRKDTDALRYCSLESIEKMSRLQYQLLEAAIHATKVGGRIVYSTCTLTPEENEAVILQILNKFSTQLEVLDPGLIANTPSEFWSITLNDSYRVQENLALTASRQPLLRLWPQTYDTEGFFCAVLQKNAPTKAVEPMEMVDFQERELSRSERQRIEGEISSIYGTSFLSERDRLFERGEMLLLSTEDVAHFDLPLKNYSLGIPFGKRLKDGRVLLDHELATLRGFMANNARLDMNESQLADLLSARDTTCPEDQAGHILLFCGAKCIGLGLAVRGVLKNRLPRWMVRYS